MNKSSRIIFVVVACIMPIFIGALHTFVHFTDLITLEVQVYLQKEFVYSGKAQPLWYGWGIMSFMMGTSFIVIGLLNISILSRIPKTHTPPVLAIIAMIIYQLCVIYAGYTFNGPFQLYGGMVGLMLLCVCLFLTVKLKTDNRQSEI